MECIYHITDVFPTTHFFVFYLYIYITVFVPFVFVLFFKIRNDEMFQLYCCCRFGCVHLNRLNPAPCVPSRSSSIMVGFTSVCC